ncbi:single-stranded-DNA-specific exonuclease RecJ [Brevibacillus ruminantium]|uniref:Single-stranded-DNA-specific exonuclease RecJ n=1 Tax=Brevibacillus ruminantium TaxID=2950604 RepID=A0ABY4WE80_9BACL|nr:single-stranded-DNA-specific exonuclease RecJ [Brevibacillus ruminantium]USG64090.1 single-stranded-DNA-specific exonuclease RecJ [Brevibacillus ruminantium]
MLKAKTRWQLAAYDNELAEMIARECGLAPLVAKLLVIRGIDTVQRAKEFMDAGPELFHDPYALHGMKESVKRIREAIERQEMICIYGDYDADGVSSTSLMVQVMRKLGAAFDTYIPNRFTEGYGLHKDALSSLKERGFTLIITVDTGISAVEQVAFAKELGLDVIVTDHHEPPEVIPEAFAVINPKQPACSYPFDMLAGVGVAFKLAHALLDEPPLDLVDLAALGTIADLVPLVDENRILAKLGLKRLNHTRNIGLQALIKVCGLSDTEMLTAGHVGFALGPRLNAGGRLETAAVAVKLLTTEDIQEAEEAAQQLDDLNCERQELVQTITDEAIQMVLEDYPLDENRVLVLAKEGWNVGVVGIVASRLVEKFYRPTIVLGIDPEKGTAKGSARSINGFDMYEALTACREWLPHYGGHTMAAGMTLPVDNLEPFRKQLNQLAHEWLTEKDFVPLTKVDVAMELADVTLQTAEQLEQLAPFGMGNPTPLVMIQDVETAGMRTIGRDQTHLKCSLVKDAGQIDAIGFNWAHIVPEVTPKARYQVIGELSVNEWNGNRKPQLTIRDLTIPHRQVYDWRGCRDKRERWRNLQDSGDVLTILFRQESYEELLPMAALAGLEDGLLSLSQEDVKAGDLKPSRVILYDLPRSRRDLMQVVTYLESAERIYCLFGDPDLGLERLSCPGREQFKLVYQFFMQVPLVQRIHLDAMARRLKLKRDLLEGMLAVLAELDFIKVEADAFRLNPEAAKQPLEGSRLYIEWREESELATELLLSSYDSLVTHFQQQVAAATS